MRKTRLLIVGAVLAILTLCLVKPLLSSFKIMGEELEENESESLRDRYAQEFEQLRDPSLNAVPAERLLQANEATRNLQRRAQASRMAGLNWQERGPIYDVVGVSNGNTRAGNEYTAGIVQTFLVNLAADPTGNVVLAGSPSGGLWRCTNFLATPAPTWQAVNDFMPNLAIASICQDPSNPSVMYLATGDANTRDVRGYGIWKSTNGGLNWSLLPGTTGFTAAFKILCDNAGNVYLASGGAAYNTGSGGLKRSSDGGVTWTNISPSNASTYASNYTYVSDLELSSTGRLHAVFGYQSTKSKHFYTDIPATVTPTTGWQTSTGIRETGVACGRMELAAQGNVLYAVTANTSYNVDSCYKSIDGGVTWALQTTSAFPSALANGQAWYALTVEINPDDPADVIIGSVDAYRSTNSGVSFNRASYWVGATAPYVHADHHTMKWFKVGTENRMMIGCDGGLFLSRNAGVSFVDRNQNLGIKQFYSCAISPNAGENFLFAGAQDNGCHQLKGAGLSSSTETSGGDGAYVHINQKDPQIQFGSYVYNQYRRSINGGQNWTPVNFSSSTGYFINPFDYDDGQNIMYASNASGSGNNQIRRWNDANTSSTSTVLTIDEMTRGAASNATAFKVSPYKADRLFIGTNRGSILRLDSAGTVAATANATANITDLTSTLFPSGYINCVNTGSSDNVLVATFTNYGISNVWVSTNGGTTWTAVDGNLPDMPVWWAVFVPGNDNKLILATEAGVYTTDALNGASTVWTAEPNFPVVRTRMLKVRASDNTIVAATYGRGLWTASLTGGCAAASISSQPASQTVCPGSNASFSVTAIGTGLTYQWRKGGVNISGATGSSYTISNVTAANAGNYDVIVTNSCGDATSTAATLTVSAGPSISTQPVSQAGCAGGTVTFSVSASGAGLGYQWRKGGNNISGATGSSLVLNNLAAADAGSYDVVVSSSCGTPVTSSAATLSLSSVTAISTQPVSQTACTGSNVSLTVAATGSGTLSYQWRKAGANISGANAATLTLTNVNVSDVGNYDVLVSGACGSVTSAAAALSVNAPTNIGTQPTSVTACAGTAANFAVSAAGTGTLTYQWRKNGIAIGGATAATYSIASLAVADAGNYDVLVTGTCGSVTSSQAVLTVNTGGGCVTAVPNVDPNATSLLLMPNVVRQNAVLRVNVQRATKVDWRVVDAQGKVVMTFSQRLGAGQTDLNLSLSKLAAGVYYLQGTTDKGKFGTLRLEKL